MKIPSLVVIGFHIYIVGHNIHNHGDDQRLYNNMKTCIVMPLKFVFAFIIIIHLIDFVSLNFSLVFAA